MSRWGIDHAGLSPRPRPTALLPTPPATSLLSGLNEVANGSHYVAKGIILFTLFYTTLNYLHYRRLRLMMEDRDKEARDDGPKKDNDDAPLN